MVSCQKGPTRHAYAWQIGPFWQDTLDLSHQLQSAQVALVQPIKSHSTLSLLIRLARVPNTTTPWEQLSKVQSIQSGRIVIWTDYSGSYRTHTQVKTMVNGALPLTSTGNLIITPLNISLFKWCCYSTSISSVSPFLFNDMHSFHVHDFAISKMFRKRSPSTSWWVCHTKNKSLV